MRRSGAPRRFLLHLASRCRSKFPHILRVRERDAGDTQAISSTSQLYNERRVLETDALFYMGVIGVTHARTCHKVQSFSHRRGRKSGKKSGEKVGEKVGGKSRGKKYVLI